ncbi:MAG: DUF3793 family protein [Butyricicoccus pullicaecorum]|nr:DUF3793 family protein [Butyricicoccus pullicaecorum]
MYSFDLLLAEHSAPVLAGLKTANLISCRKEWYPDLPEMLTVYQQAFAARGICFRILCSCDYRFLLLIYRPERLLKDLESVQVRELLQRYRYPMYKGLDALIDHLSERTSNQKGFPHEIGVFLGYPIEDVYGFIEQQGKDCKLSGYWKVYGDVQAARRLFRQFDRCRDTTRGYVERGMTILELFAA